MLLTRSNTIHLSAGILLLFASGSAVAESCEIKVCSPACIKGLEVHRTEVRRAYIYQNGYPYSRLCNDFADPEDREACFLKNIAFEKDFPLSEIEAHIRQWGMQSDANPDAVACEARNTKREEAENLKHKADEAEAERQRQAEEMREAADPQAQFIRQQQYRQQQGPLQIDNIIPALINSFTR